MILFIFGALGLTGSIYRAYNSFPSFLVNILIFLYNFHYSFRNALESFHCLLVMGDLVFQFVPVHLNFIAV